MQHPKIKIPCEGTVKSIADLLKIEIEKIFNNTKQQYTVGIGFSLFSLFGL